MEPTMEKHKTVLAKLLELQNMDLKDLRQLWSDLYKSNAPKSSTRKSLIRLLSYRIQELALGGDSSETKARLDAKAESLFGKRGRKIRPAAGSILTREYHGIEHQVAVLEDGFEYSGAKFKSLSAIAKHITGMSWSGIAFFSLKQRSRK